MDSILVHCNKCNQDKPETDFYRYKTGKLKIPCKECIKADNKARYVPKPPKHPPVPEGYKWCSRCQQAFAATTEFFYSNKSRFDGLNSLCKACHQEYEYARIQQKPKETPPETLTCVKCNVEKPATQEYFPVSETCSYGLQPTCKTCRNAEKREYYHTHPEFREHLAAYAKGLPQEKKECRKAYIRKWHHTNCQRQLAYKRTYRKLPHVRAYRRIENHKRRARLVQAPGSHTHQDIQRQYERQKGRCYWCDLKLGKGKRAYHVDHVIPLSRGGSDGPENLVITCHSCNESKNDRLPHEWEGNNGKLW